MKKFKLAASIVCADMLDIRGEVQRIERGGADLIHFDVMDGDFVPRFGLHPEMLCSIRSISKLPIDVHLMVNSPVEYVKDFALAGATYLTVHVESTNHLHRAISTIKGLGVKAGIALNPGTSITAIEEVITEIDMVLLMAINPGIVGHKIIPSTFAKIQRCREMIDRSAPGIPIMIDGGVTYQSAAEMLSAGAEMLVCGSSTIFQPDAPVDVKLGQFRNCIKSKPGFES